MKYLIVDDLDLNFSTLAPLRSQLEIRAGILKLRQKIEGYLGIEDVYLIVDKKLEELYKERFLDKKINTLPQGQVCFVNGRIQMNEEIAELINKQKINTILTNDKDDLLSIKISNEQESNCDSESFLKMDFSHLQKIKEDIKLWDSIDQILLANYENIKADYRDFFYDKDNYSETEQGVTIINPYDVWIGDGAELKHGAVLDASKGPIIVDEGAIIGLNAIIQGPAYIGKATELQALSLIRGGTSIGQKSTIGGEAVACIIQGYSTKPFRGTLHKCYVGEWTKFEAGISIDSDFFDQNRITKIRDYSLSFLFNNHSGENICQYQEMRKSKLEAMKFDKNVEFSKLELKLIKQYLNEEI
ncbi:hypothetical protein JEZ13_03645 [bacterium]|nr:hypothetical protein [bacterium]